MAKSERHTRGRPAAYDRSVVLDKALAVFWRQGFDGASLSELEQATGLSRSSLYAAFGNKEALFEQTVEHYVTHTAGFVVEALGQPRLHDAIAAFLRGAAEFLTSEAHPPGCFVILGALVCAPDSEAARQTLIARRHGLERVLTQRLDAGLAAGELVPEAEASLLGKYVATVHQGMAVQASTGASKQDLLEVAELGLSTLERWLVPPVR